MTLTLIKIKLKQDGSQVWCILLFGLCIRKYSFNLVSQISKLFVLQIYWKFSNFFSMLYFAWPSVLYLPWTKGVVKWVQNQSPWKIPRLSKCVVSLGKVNEHVFLKLCKHKKDVKETIHVCHLSPQCILYQGDVCVFSMQILCVPLSQTW